jgi:hypothetical protein
MVRRTCTQWLRWTATLPMSATTWGRSTTGISRALNLHPLSVQAGVAAGVTAPGV